MQVVIDCDSGTFDLVLNAILCLAAASSVSSAIENTRILCLHESCCAMARAAGFHVLHRSALSDMSRGFSLQHVNSMAHLDTVMLVREMYILQLLEQGVDVLRLDADICVTTDLGASQELDILASAQQVAGRLAYGWAFPWACPGRKDPKYTLTMNNGFALLKGTNPAVLAHYAAATGRSLSIAMSEPGKGRDGWAQRGFNIQLNESGFCLPSLRNAAWDGRLLKGSTATHGASGGLRVGAFSVCSPCMPSHCNRFAMALHANCLYRRLGKQQSYSEFIASGMQRKREYLASRCAWLLRPGAGLHLSALEALPRNGQAEAYLRGVAISWPPQVRICPATLPNHTTSG